MGNKIVRNIIWFQLYIINHIIKKDNDQWRDKIIIRVIDQMSTNQFNSYSSIHFIYCRIVIILLFLCVLLLVLWIEFLLFHHFFHFLHHFRIIHFLHHFRIIHIKSFHWILLLFHPRLLLEWGQEIDQCFLSIFI